MALLLLIKIFHQIFLVTLSYIFASKPLSWSSAGYLHLHTAHVTVRCLGVSGAGVCWSRWLPGGDCHEVEAGPWPPVWGSRRRSNSYCGTPTPARRHAPGPQHCPAHTCPNQTCGPGLTQRAPYSEKVPIAHCLHVKSSSKQAVGLHLNFHQQAVWLAKILKTAGQKRSLWTFR